MYIYLSIAVASLRLERVDGKCPSDRHAVGYSRPPPVPGVAEIVRRIHYTDLPPTV